MNRREWLQKSGAAAAGALAAPYTRTLAGTRPKLDCVFQLSVITDEITQDFGHAVEVAAKEFGVGLVELRGLWKKNIVNLDEKEVAEAKSVLAKYDLQVTDIASPLFKVDWPGAPKSKYSPTGDAYAASFTFEQQDEVLERATAMARQFGTNKVRLFDFWRLEAARTLDAVKNKNFFLNWDPGNAARLGDKAFPEGYELLPKERIGHMHLKDVKREANGDYGWECMGRGIIDYVGQFKAMMRDGYHGTMSLETHWNGTGNMEESSRQSMAGTKELLRKAGALK